MTIIGEPIIGGDFIGDIIGGSHPRTKVYEFNGTTMFATMGTTWEPLGLPYTISFKYTTDDVSTLAYMLGNSAGTLYPSAKIVIGATGYGYVDVDSANQTAAGGSGLSADTIYTFSVTADGTNVTVSIDGVDGTPAAFVSKSVGLGGLEFIGSANDPIASPFGGAIWNLRLTDDSPLQDRPVMTCNATRYIALNNPIVLGTTWEIEFDLIRQDDSGTTSQALLGSADGNNIIRLYDTSATKSHDLDLVINTATLSFANALEDIAIGQHCNIRIVRTAATSSITLYIDGVFKTFSTGASGAIWTIDQIGKAGSVNATTSSIGNVLITDSASGNTWFYALEDES